MSCLRGRGRLNVREDSKHQNYQLVNPLAILVDALVLLHSYIITGGDRVNICFAILTRIGAVQQSELVCVTIS